MIERYVIWLFNKFFFSNYVQKYRLARWFSWAEKRPNICLDSEDNQNKMPTGWVRTLKLPNMKQED
jgi:hypothetical protein